ncbi:HAD-IIB family hydrolase [Homoserinimonas sp. OAct 916]|uniref:HAD-IIB family hydrolase n=1 Tax=Homoserinimonas sp. OAct 916 TaxID=2211450 RepID=UPI001E3DA8FF|nr:HAD-IIB family hydrolase [Homoserinimonas sp. OAct 916]
MSDAATARSAELVPEGDRMLIALDIDGTLLDQNGVITDVVARAVSRIQDLGHEITLATGRSVATMMPVLNELELTPEYAVCSNGAITLRRDATEPSGYRQEYVETFDPKPVLITLRRHLANARFAVEDTNGYFRYTDQFPDSSIGHGGEQVEFEGLLEMEATRVVVISPDHDMEEFARVVDDMGLHRVSYAVGWTAWLDIAPDGVNKATALERVRENLNIPRDRVVVIGDGRNDIDMLEWAGAHGRGVAMAHSPEDVLAAASEVTTALFEDGVARVLDSI